MSEWFQAAGESDEEKPRPTAEDYRATLALHRKGETRPDWLLQYDRAEALLDAGQITAAGRLVTKIAFEVEAKYQTHIADAEQGGVIYALQVNDTGKLVWKFQNILALIQDEEAQLSQLRTLERNAIDEWDAQLRAKLNEPQD